MRGTTMPGIPESAKWGTTALGPLPEVRALDRNPESPIAPGATADPTASWTKEGPASEPKETRSARRVGSGATKSIEG